VIPAHRKLHHQSEAGVAIGRERGEEEGLHCPGDGKVRARIMPTASSVFAQLRATCFVSLLLVGRRERE